MHTLVHLNTLMHGDLSLSSYLTLPQLLRLQTSAGHLKRIRQDSIA